MSEEMIKVGVPQCPLCGRRFKDMDEAAEHECEDQVNG